MTKRPKLLMLKGLPASGKTTYARELVEKQGYVRVNKDDLRAMMHNGEWSKGNETEILRVRDNTINAALDDGKSVVVDDTNFAAIHQNTLERVAGRRGAEFEVLFIDTPLEECISRNEKRANKVPLNVITEMHGKYIAPLRKTETPEYDDDLEECIIVDIDGTLAHIDPDNTRSPYDGSRAHEDLVDDAVSCIVNMAYGHGYKIIVLTGRGEEHYEVTSDWLTVNGINHDELYSRALNDVRKDTIVKQELYVEHIKDKYNVKFVIDDRPSVCRMWREQGLKVLQVGDPHIEF